MKCITPYKKAIAGNWIDLPCGKCYPCKQRRISDWSTRLHFEEMYSNSSIFLTLTYSYENLKFLHTKKFASLYKRDIQLFLKRLRKYEAAAGNTRKIKYICAGEYGTKHKRPHYHLLIFNATEKGILESWTKESNGKHSPLGSVYFGNVARCSIAYVVGYIAANEANSRHASRYNLQKQFLTFSKGLGAAYIRPTMVEYHGTHPELRCFVTVDGQKRHMPRYYQQKIYSATRWNQIKEYMAQIKVEPTTWSIENILLNSHMSIEKKRKDYAF